MRDGAHHVAHASLRAGEAASYRPCTEKVKQTGELNPVGVSEVEACPELVEGLRDRPAGMRATACGRYYDVTRFRSDCRARS